MKAENDPHNLDRFLRAQEQDFELALREIRAGEKRSHWMWYIFPQVAGLGFSATSRLYAIQDLEEARAYLNHPVLGPRLVQCAEALLALEGRTAHQIFGSPDDLKLRSCLTLFACASPPGSIYERILAKYFPEGKDAKTEDLLSRQDR